MPTIDDIELELAVTDGFPAPAIVWGYVARYPEHAKAILEFAVWWILDGPEAGPAVDPDPREISEAVDRAMARFYQMLDRRD